MFCFVDGGIHWLGLWCLIQSDLCQSLPTSCVQTTHTLCLCLWALTGPGGDGGEGREGKGVGQLRMYQTLSFSPRYSNFCFWHVEALGPSILPLTAQLLIQAGEGRQIWCKLAALKVIICDIFAFIKKCLFFLPITASSSGEESNFIYISCRKMASRYSPQLLCKNTLAMTTNQKKGHPNYCENLFICT